MAKPLPSTAVLRKLLEYEPNTGKLYWKLRDPSMFNDTKARTAEHTCKIWNMRYAGKECGNQLDSNGRFRSTILAVDYQTSRVAWKIHYGTEPVDVIDHIDGDALNNRISNLRDVSYSGNSKNSSRRTDNSSGCTGVIFFKNSGKWAASISSNGKRYSLGHYRLKQDAIVARKAAEKKHGFHDNHGRN